MKKNRQQKHWSNYWQAGQLTSLPQDFENNYEGSIFKEWNNCFSQIKNNGVVLDICTGNCAVALLASEYSIESKKEIGIYAVDAANINKEIILKSNPSLKQKLEKIELIPNCFVEEIDFSEGYFDLITSQYGVEYANWEAAAKKIFSLLKKNGQFTMICHAASSTVIETMEKEKSDYSILINLNLFSNFERYAKNKLSYRELIKTIKRIQNNLNIKFKQKPSELLRSVIKFNENIVNTNKKTLEENRNELYLFGVQHKSAYKRMQDLLNVSSRIHKNPNWYKSFIKAGLSLDEKKPLYYKNKFHCGELYKFHKNQL